MAIKITEKMILQLTEVLSDYKLEWCEVVLEIENGEFLICPGQLEIRNNEILFQGNNNNKLYLFFNTKYNLPFFKIVEKFQIRENFFINLYLKFIFSDTAFSNQWKPPMEVLYPGKNEYHEIPIISEVEFMKKIDLIFTEPNNNKNIVIHYSYFSENIEIIKEFLFGNSIIKPKIISSKISGQIKFPENYIEANKKKYGFSYNSKLNLAKIIEIDELKEKYITELVLK